MHATPNPNTVCSLSLPFTGTEIIFHEVIIRYIVIGLMGYLGSNINGLNSSLPRRIL